MDTLTLPRLREALELLPGPHAADGSPTWSIFDPPRNRYFRIGWLAFEMLSRWYLQTSDRLVERVRQDTNLEVNRDDVETLTKFLWQNSLTRDSASGKSSDYLEQYNASRTRISQWLMHHYLFFRIPLVRPDRFLDATRRWAEPLYSRTFAAIVMLTGLIGLYLTARQWDQFIHTFLYFFTWESFFFYAAALIVIKAFHELGHAYTAKRYGCRIPTMGVAFLVMFPVLYTDTTNAWRLTSRRQRVHIAMAGMLTELTIAVFATVAWAILPDGPVRSIAFFAATTSWVLSLLININPLMRFDGYYLLSDFLGIDNLQERSFQFGRWKLRHLLFGAPDAKPENVSSDMQRFLTLFGWAVWIYRFFLFLAIALLVYHLFFKLLGLILFAVEITWFIIMPVARELKVWWNNRRRYFVTWRFALTTCLLLTGFGLLFIPWQETTRFPAILEYTQQTSVYPHEPGRVAEILISEGDHVKKGEPLVRLESPEIEYALRQEAEKIRIIEFRIDRMAGSAKELANLNVLYEQLNEARSALSGLESRRDELTLKAPIDGEVLDLARGVHEGRWLNPSQAVAFIGAMDQLQVKGYLEENKLTGVAAGGSAEFVPDDPQRAKLPTTIVDIEQTDSGEFDEPYLASVYGGDIAVREDRNGDLVPETSIYRVRLDTVALDKPPRQVVTGIVRAQGEPLSLFERMYRQVAGVVIREAGF